MNREILQLLSGDNPRQAQDFILAFGDYRTSSWSDAQRQASLKSASKRRLPHYRGQLRHQLGETALANAARAANIGCIPVPTIRPGGVFMVARLARFGLVSMNVANKRTMPRRSPTRRLLSSPNDLLDPQQKLALADRTFGRGATELAYFGCMVACPAYPDPSTPAQLAFAIPNAKLADWIEWIPLTRLHALLQDIIDEQPRVDIVPFKPIVDRRFPTFRLPKHDRDVGGGGTGN